MRPSATTTHLVIAEARDQSAAWVYEQVKRRLGDVYAITIDEFMQSQWSYHIDRRGCWWILRLANGSEVRSDTLRSVLNLCPALPAWTVADVQKDDREYAYYELSATLAGMLAAVKGPVINKPVPFSLSGAERSFDNWQRLAANAGLPVRRLSRWDGMARSTSTADRLCAYLVDDLVICERHLPDRVAEGLRRFGRQLPEHLLKVEVEVVDGNHVFASAQHAPDLYDAGVTVIDALVDVMNA